MLNLVSAVIDLLDGTIVKLFEGAGDLNNNVSRGCSFLLAKSSERISEDGLLGIASVHCTVRYNKVCPAKDLLKVALWFLLKEVTASDFLYSTFGDQHDWTILTSLRSHASFLESILTVDIVDCLGFHYTATVSTDKWTYRWRAHHVPRKPERTSFGWSACWLGCGEGGISELGCGIY